MEEELKNALRDKETVLWKSRPAPFELLDAENKASVLVKWIVSAVVALTFCILYFSHNDTYNYYVIGFVFLLVLAVAISPLTARSAISRQLYAVTNQRVFVVTKDRTAYYMEFNDIDAMRVLKSANGHHTLALGSSILPKIEKNVRWTAAHPKTEGQGEHAVGMVLYSLPDVDAVLCLLPRQPAGERAA